MMLFGGVLGTIGTTQAASTEEVGYNIQAVIPENQVDQKNSYFDLRMQPKQEETIQVIVNNTSNTKGTYKIKVNQAYTNASGFIDYAQAVQPDKTLRYPIGKLVSAPKSITVPANSSKKFSLKIKMPAKQYDGQILAGIQVNKVLKKQKKGISNAYGYVLGLKLTETDNEVARDLKLVAVKPAAKFGKTSVVAVLRNPTMDAYGHLKYKANITSLATNKTIYRKTYDNNMQMAPNSTYDFAMTIGKRLKAGKYKLELTVSDAKNNKWTFAKHFTITQKQADTVNNATIDQGKPSYTWLYILLGVIAALLLIVILLLLKRRKEK
ncbi:cell surface protein [Lactobacillus selangorensis]|uniref:Cell surface protein n=2 Tax=Lactobacillus selangorensis TaxID=81857 RepID=A0A0R2G0M3_9LACO|nr:cell surface protein [Lactobacillus selangorensis]KRN32934.1 cell surface protein [Lactobacillus selangorensis]